MSRRTGSAIPISRRRGRERTCSARLVERFQLAGCKRLLDLLAADSPEG